MERSFYVPKRKATSGGVLSRNFQIWAKRYHSYKPSFRGAEVGPVVGFVVLPAYAVPLNFLTSTPTSPLLLLLRTGSRLGHPMESYRR